MDGMSIRRVKIVLLCEDSQHEAFARRFLGGMGWNTREIRVEKSPSAGGSAEQWVREISKGTQYLSTPEATGSFCHDYHDRCRCQRC
jgi:hypothetical protein